MHRIRFNERFCDSDYSTEFQENELCKNEETGQKWTNKQAKNS